MGTNKTPNPPQQQGIQGRWRERPGHEIDTLSILSKIEKSAILPTGNSIQFLLDWHRIFDPCIDPPSTSHSGVSAS